MVDEVEQGEALYYTGCACPAAGLDKWSAMRAEYRRRDDLFCCLECGWPIRPMCTPEVDEAFQSGGKIHPRGTMTDSEFAAWLGGPFPRSKFFLPTAVEG